MTTKKKSDNTVHLGAKEDLAKIEQRLNALESNIKEIKQALAGLPAGGRRRCNCLIPTVIIALLIMVALGFHCKILGSGKCPFTMLRNIVSAHTQQNPVQIQKKSEFPTPVNAAVIPNPPQKLAEKVADPSKISAPAQAPAPSVPAQTPPALVAPEKKTEPVAPPTAVAVEKKAEPVTPPVAPATPTATSNTNPVPAEGKKITIYEYSEFQCPYCSRFYASTYKELKKKFGDQIEFVFKHFPLQFHENAQKAAEATECARDQGKFWEMHDRLFENQTKLALDDLKAHASALGLDTAKFNACLDGGTHVEKIKNDQQEGQQKGITGTPSFVVGNCPDPLFGALPTEEFERYLTEVLAGKCPGANDPEVAMIVINDKSCGQCQQLVEQIVGYTKSNLFKKLTIETLDYSEEKGKTLATELDIAALPAFIFKAEVAKAFKFAQVQGTLTKKEGTSLGTIYSINSWEIGAPKRLKLPTVGDSPFMGKADAPVTIIEFADYQCPYCQKVQDSIKKVKEVYGDYVKFVYRHYPLSSIHPEAQKAAEAAECANDQGKFWEMHDRLYTSQDKLALDALKEHAKTLGLDSKTFDSCLDSAKYAEKVKKDFAEGQANGVRGIPAFFINSYVNAGALPFEKFQEVIDGELKAKGITPPVAPKPKPEPDMLSDKPHVVKILEYSDFQCPFCKRGYETIKKVKEQYGDKVEVVFKQFPLPMHENAQKAAEASECARDQGKFWEMHDRLFENQEKLTVADLKEHAKTIGLDSAKFDTCLDKGEKANVVKADSEQGAKRGIRGTPHFYVNGEEVNGAQPFEKFSAIIDPYLK